MESALKINLFVLPEILCDAVFSVEYLHIKSKPTLAELSIEKVNHSLYNVNLFLNTLHNNLT